MKNKLFLLLDISPSMNERLENETRLEIATEGFNQIKRQLGNKYDEVVEIYFSTTASMHMDSVKVGWTNIYAAIELALNELGDKNDIYIFTDGENNVFDRKNACQAKYQLEKEKVKVIIQGAINDNIVNEFDATGLSHNINDKKEFSKSLTRGIKILSKTLAK